MTVHPQSTRRTFLRQAGTATFGAIAAPLVIPASALGGDDKPAPSNRITLGVIGTGNQGFNDIRGMLSDPRVQIVAVCDVNKESAGYWQGAVAGREPGRRLVEQHYAADTKAGKYKGCAAFSDFRELIARKDIDAVVIATPTAGAAGPAAAKKALPGYYCQKPLDDRRGGR